jgi:hypothetical protein
MKPGSYAYVRRAYRVEPRIGERVVHLETGRAGKIADERASHQHYVFVRFDGDLFDLPCHPTSLSYRPERDRRP